MMDILFFADELIFYLSVNLDDLQILKVCIHRRFPCRFLQFYNRILLSFDCRSLICWHHKGSHCHVGKCCRRRGWIGLQLPKAGELKEKKLRNCFPIPKREDFQKEGSIADEYELMTVEEIMLGKVSCINLLIILYCSLNQEYIYRAMSFLG